MIRSALILLPRLKLLKFKRLSAPSDVLQFARPCGFRTISSSIYPFSESKNEERAITSSPNGRNMNKEIEPHKVTSIDLTPKETSSKTDIPKMLLGVANSIKNMVLNPRDTWNWIKKEALHYWVGTKLLWSEIKITKQIMGRMLRGHEMTRRERLQLMRTTTDMFRLVPFAIFVIVPFMELLLPFALKIFPNMLPSTFQDKLQAEESMKKELQMRLAIAKFMQETMQELASKKASKDGGSSGASEIMDFVDKARAGEPISNETVISIAKLFKDDLTLANITRPQLVSMCKYMGLQAFGSDPFLRFQLRNKLRALKEDDRRILWEGIDSLNTIELRDACRERGMRSIGLTQFKLKNQLQEWLELSTQKNIPISLLIMSRAFSLTTAADDAEEVLKTSMSSLDSDTINEVILASATTKEEDSLAIRQRKLESLKFQQEMIDEEIKKKTAETNKQTELKPSKTTEVVDSSASSPKKSLTDAISGKSDSESEKVVKALDASAPAPVDKPKELNVNDIQALADLARGSSLQREKQELDSLQGTIDSLQLVAAKNSTKAVASVAAVMKATVADILPVPETVKAAVSSVTISPPVAAASAEDASLVRMQSVLESMLDKLKIKIDSTEKVVGDKLNLLDKDGDGSLSSEELRDAITKLLKRNYSLEEADQLVAMLDNDKDGKISLVELLSYVKQRQDNREAGTVSSPESSAASVNTTKQQQALESSKVFANKEKQ